MRTTLALLMLAAMPAVVPSTAHAEWLAGGTPVHVGPQSQHDPTLAPDGLGGMFVAWIHPIDFSVATVRETGDQRRRPRAGLARRRFAHRHGHERRKDVREPAHGSRHTRRRVCDVGGGGWPRDPQLALPSEDSARSGQRHHRPRMARLGRGATAAAEHGPPQGAGCRRYAWGAGAVADLANIWVQAACIACNA